MLRGVQTAVGRVKDMKVGAWAQGSSPEGRGVPFDAFLCCLCSFANKRTCQALVDTARRFAGVACPHVLANPAIDREGDVGVLANAPEPCLPVVVVIRSVRALSLEMPVCRDWRDLSAVAVPTDCRRIFALGVSGSWLS